MQKCHKYIDNKTNNGGKNEYLGKYNGNTE